MRKLLSALRSQYRRTPPRASIIIIGDPSSRECALSVRSVRQQTCNPEAYEIVIVGTTPSPADPSHITANASENLALVNAVGLEQFAALQRGVEHARGVWCVPLQCGETLDPDYIKSVLGFIDSDLGASANLLLTRPMLLDPATHERTPPRGAQDIFAFGTRITDLSDRPEDICLPHKAMFHTQTLKQVAMTQCDQPAMFGNDYLMGMYLSCCDAPTLGIVAEAQCNVTGNFNTPLDMWRTQKFYRDRVQSGFAPYLDTLHQRYGFVPKWAQICVLNYVFRYFTEDRSPAARTAWLNASECAEFLAALRPVFKYIDIDTVREFCIFGVRWIIRESLVAYFYSIRADAPGYYRWADDRRTKNMALTVVRHVASPPLSFEIDGERVTPLQQKIISHSYFGATMVYEYVVRLPPGEELVVRTQDQVFHREDLVTGHLKPPADHDRVATQHPQASPPDAVITSRHALKERAATPEVIARYRDAWMLIDRPHAAGDNAEHLYRHLQRAHPEISCFFVLKRTSPDWSRLSADGFNLVDYDADETILLAMNTAIRASSDASDAVLHPRPGTGLTLRGKFVFLQHGVLMHDLSAWLNHKPIDLMIASSHAEYDALVGDYSPYRFSAHNVALTGLPRFDALARARAKNTPAQHILIMPTWRKNLVEALDNHNDSREIRAVFENSEFGKQWLHITQELAAQTEIILVLHPRLRELRDHIKLPDNVRVTGLDDINFGHELAKSFAVLTDYSSIAFDAAYLDVPVIYYQPPGADILDGSHTTRRGAFTYESDGMGPIAGDPAACLAWVAASKTPGTPTFAIYRERAQKTFAYIDEHNSERVVAAIQGLL